VPVSNALRRLLQVREVEEDQHKAALALALGELRSLENALRAAEARERAGRAHIAAGAHSPDPADRIAAMVEAEAGRHAVHVLARRVNAAAAGAAALRAEYLAHRIERRQLGTVIRETEEQEEAGQTRSQQQKVDEWFGVRRHARASARLTALDSTTARQASAKHEIKKDQESPAVPEAELRSNL